MNGKKIFLDTSPIIYLLDSDKNFGMKACRIFGELAEKKFKFVTSVITVEEYLVYPYRTNNLALVKTFWEFVTENKIELHKIGFDEAEKAAQIRAKYKHFKALDSLQLAVATLQGCELFLTNDKQLKQFDAVECVTVEEWEI